MFHDESCNCDLANKTSHPERGRCIFRHGLVDCTPVLPWTNLFAKSHQTPDGRTLVVGTATQGFYTIDEITLLVTYHKNTLIHAADEHDHLAHPVTAMGKVLSLESSGHRVWRPRVVYVFVGPVDR